LIRVLIGGVLLVVGGWDGGRGASLGLMLGRGISVGLIGWLSALGRRGWTGLLRGWWLSAGSLGERGLQGRGRWLWLSLLELLGMWILILLLSRIHRRSTGIFKSLPLPNRRVNVRYHQSRHHVPLATRDSSPRYFVPRIRLGSLKDTNPKSSVCALFPVPDVFSLRLVRQIRQDICDQSSGWSEVKR
jgi:hypothetical protein